MFVSFAVIMVRFLFLSKPIEEQTVRRCHGTSFERLRVVANVLRLQGMCGPVARRIVKVAVCLDGGSRMSLDTARKGLTDLYEVLRQRQLIDVFVDVHVREFSFCGQDWTWDAAVLRGADVFMFGGVFGVSDRLREALCAGRPETDSSNLAACLRVRVQYGNMPYIGICGGAKIAGDARSSTYGVGLNLLGGHQVEYGWNREVDLRIDKVCFTNQCCLALVLTVESIQVAFFPVVKNIHHLLDFAARCEECLAASASHIGSSWLHYDYPQGGAWSFQLCGMVCDDRTGVCRPILH